MGKSMRSEMAGKAKESAAQMGEKANGMLDSAHDTATDVSHRAQESSGDFTKGASAYVEEDREIIEALDLIVGGRVQEWPRSELLVSAGIGLLCGAVIARR